MTFQQRQTLTVTKEMISSMHHMAVRKSRKRLNEALTRARKQFQAVSLGFADSAAAAGRSCNKPPRGCSTAVTLDRDESRDTASNKVQRHQPGPSLR